MAAVDGAPEAAHQRRDLGTDRELAARAGFHQSDALDPADLRRLRPFTPAHVHLRVVQAERLDLDDDMSG
jgi:hypothetical protein